MSESKDKGLKRSAAAGVPVSATGAATAASLAGGSQGSGGGEPAVDTVEGRARSALGESLKALATAWGIDPDVLHILGRTPLIASELPAISITFPGARVLPVGLGGFLSTEQSPSGTPRSVVGMRLEGPARLQVWVAAGGTPSAGVREIERLVRFVSAALSEPAPVLRRAGILRLRQSAVGDVVDVQPSATWTIGGQGLTCSMTCQLIFETTFTPAEAESILRTVDVTVQGPGKHEQFQIR